MYIICSVKRSVIEKKPGKGGWKVDKELLFILGSQRPH